MRIKSVAVVGVILFALVVGCAPVATPETVVETVEVPVKETVIVEVTPKPEELQTIKFGCAFNYTGAEALSGLDASDATQLAVDEANSQGFIPGYRIELLKLDDATAAAGQMDPAQAAANARQFAADPDVVLVIGPDSSTQGKAHLPIAAEAGLPYLCSMASNVDLTDPAFTEFRMADGSPVFFRTVTNDGIAPPMMGKYLSEELGVETVFTLDDGSAFGVGTIDNFEARADDFGIEIVGRDRLDPQATDYGAVITRIAGMEPDALFMGGGFLATGRFALQAQGRMGDTIMSGSGNVAHPAFIENATAEGAEGWYGVFGLPDTTIIPGAQDFIAKYEARFGRSPTAMAVLGYDNTWAAMDVIRQLVVAGKPVTREAVRDGIAQVEWEGVAGTVAFDENGDTLYPGLTMYHIEDGQLVNVGWTP